MMQNVASTKSDVAAFAAIGEQNEPVELNSEFEQIFQQQTLKQSSNTQSAYQYANKQRKTSEIQSKINDKLEKVEPSKSLEQNDAETVMSDSPKLENKNAIAQDAKNEATKLSNDNAQIIEDDVEQESAFSESENVENTPSTLQNETENEQQAEDWLALVAHLQALAANEQSIRIEKSSKVEYVKTEAQTGLSDTSLPQTKSSASKSQDLNDVLLMLKSTDKNQDINALLKQMGFASMSEVEQKLNELAAKQPTKFERFMVEVENNTSVPKVLNLLANISLESKDDIVISPEVSKTDSVKIDIKSFVEDVNQLLKLNKLSVNEVKLIQQELSASINNERKITSDVVDLIQSKLIDNHKDDKSLILGLSEKERVDSKQQLTELKSLLLKMSQNSDAKPVLVTSTTQTDILATKVLVPNSSDQVDTSSTKFSQAEASLEAEVTLTPKTQIAEQIVLDQSDKKWVVNTSDQNKPVLTHVTDKDHLEAKKVISDADLKALMDMPTKKLDETLINIAQRVATILAEEAKSQPKGTKVVTEMQAANNSEINKDIISALKAGVAEFKEQLASGREAAVDLKTWVNQAISKSDDISLSVHAAKRVEQSIAGLSQALSLASEIAESSQRQQALAAIDINIDKSLTQTELTKLQAQTQFEGKLEKAINLTKPEAHQQLAEKVRWMVNTNNLVAEIRLDPAELGTMHVKVSLSADSASVNFVVQSHQTRDALESAAPRLREMLAEKGIELGQSSVRQDSQAKQDGQGEQQTKSTQKFAAEHESFMDDDTTMVRPPRDARQLNGGIDYFV
jgi:flagellar hook-length control protein FliK